jgi:methyltransferase-like protein
MVEELEVEAVVNSLTDQEYLRGLKLNCTHGFFVEEHNAHNNRIEKIAQTVAAANERIKGLSEIIDSQKQTHDALLKKIAKFQAREAVLVERLKYCLENLDGIEEGTDIPSTVIRREAREALTTAEALERVREKDRVIKSFLDIFRMNEMRAFCLPAHLADKINEAIEAARALEVGNE